MKYVKRSAQVLLVDDSEVEKYRRKGFEEFQPPDADPVKSAPKQKSAG